jgi:cbb3-type cytochrome oxidase subunit 3
MSAFIQISFLLAFIAMGVFFLLTQQKTFEAITPENRLMQPGNVWMQLIPIYNLYWYFVVVNKLSLSIAAEYSRLSIDKSEQNPTQNIGIATGVLYFVTIIPEDTIQGFASLAWMVCFIIYWVQIFRCKNKIIANRDNYLLDAEKELLERAGN